MSYKKTRQQYLLVREILKIDKTTVSVGKRDLKKNKITVSVGKRDLKNRQDNNICR